MRKVLTKGDKVYIEGRIKTRKWQDDKGMDRYSTEIQCTDFTFLTTKNVISKILSSTCTTTAQPQQPYTNDAA